MWHFIQRRVEEEEVGTAYGPSGERKRSLKLEGRSKVLEGLVSNSAWFSGSV